MTAADGPASFECDARAACRARSLPSKGAAIRTNVAAAKRERDARDNVGNAGGAMRGCELGHRRGGKSHPRRRGGRRAPCGRRHRTFAQGAIVDVAPASRHRGGHAQVRATTASGGFRGERQAQPRRVGHASGHLRREALGEHHPIANAWKDGNPRATRVSVAAERRLKVLNLAVDVQIGAARVEAGCAHRRPGPRVRTRGEEHTSHSGQCLPQRHVVVERQPQRGEAGRLSQRRQLRGVAAGQERTMPAAYGFVENQSSGAAVRTVEHPIRSHGSRHRSLVLVFTRVTAVSHLVRLAPSSEIARAWPFPFLASTSHGESTIAALSYANRGSGTATCSSRGPLTSRSVRRYPTDTIV